VHQQQSTTGTISLQHAHRRIVSERSYTFTSAILSQKCSEILEKLVDEVPRDFRKRQTLGQEKPRLHFERNRRRVCVHVDACLPTSGIFSLRSVRFSTLYRRLYCLIADRVSTGGNAIASVCPSVRPPVCFSL